MPEDKVDLVSVFPEYERIFALPIFIEEWKAKFGKTGQIIRMTQSLKKKLEYINRDIDGDFTSENVIEKLTGVQDFFSIRVEPRSINARVICVLCNIEHKKCIILLHSFQEKNISKTRMKSYNKAEAVARKRYEDLRMQLPCD